VRLTVRSATAGPAPPLDPVARRRPAGRPGRRGRLVGTLFTIPAWVLLAAAVVTPLVVAVATSFTDDNLVQTSPSRYVGKLNYAEQVFTSGFRSSLVVTVLIIVFSIAVQLPVGFFLASLLVRPFRGRWAVRAAVTIPMMLTPVAVGLMWRFLADPDLGVIRWLASAFDAGAHPNLFGSQVGALALIVAVNSWINVPFVTLLLMAGLVGIPAEVEEAAAIDGARRVQIVWYIILPMLLPVIAVVTLLRVAADYRMFDLIYVVTQGGPGDATQNLSMLSYQHGLVDFQIGAACAIGVAMAVLALPAYFFYSRVTRS
jgi:ABC-type sugar transport system permease subunit